MSLTSIYYVRASACPWTVVTRSGSPTVENRRKGRRSGAQPKGVGAVVAVAVVAVVRPPSACAGHRRRRPAAEEAARAAAGRTGWRCPAARVLRAAAARSRRGPSEWRSRRPPRTSAAGRTWARRPAARPVVWARARRPRPRHTRAPARRWSRSPCAGCRRSPTGRYHRGGAGCDAGGVGGVGTLTTRRKAGRCRHRRRRHRSTPSPSGRPTAAVRCTPVRPSGRRRRVGRAPSWTFRATHLYAKTRKKSAVKLMSYEVIWPIWRQVQICGNLKKKKKMVNVDFMESIAKKNCFPCSSRCTGNSFS